MTPEPAHRHPAFADTGERDPLGHDDVRTAVLERPLTNGPVQASATGGALTAHAPGV